MKSCFIVCCIFFLGAISSILLLLYMASGSREDFVVAKSLKRYPNTVSYEIKYGSGFPDGSPSADIDLKTNDSPEQIIAFYKAQLIEKGWEDLGPAPIDDYQLYKSLNNRFSKTIGGKIFRVSVNATYKNQYLSNTNSLIFVSHNIRNYDY